MEQLNERQLFGTTLGTAQGEVRWNVVAQGLGRPGLGCHGEFVEPVEVRDGRCGASATRRPQPGVSVHRSRRQPGRAGRDGGAVPFEVYSGPLSRQASRKTVPKNSDLTAKVVVITGAGSVAGRLTAR